MDASEGKTTQWEKNSKKWGSPESVTREGLLRGGELPRLEASPSEPDAVRRFYSDVPLSPAPDPPHHNLLLVGVYVHPNPKYEDP